MKRALLFFGTITLISVITMHLRAEYKQSHPLPPKLYPVSLSLEEWQLRLNHLEYIKQYLKSTNLPSKETNLISDSILAPFQNMIGGQIQTILAQEKSAQQKRDTTKPKKN